MADLNVLVWLVPIALLMGLIGLCAFLWSMRHGQYEDLDGAAERILINADQPIPDRAIKDKQDGTPSDDEHASPDNRRNRGDSKSV